VKLGISVLSREEFEYPVPLEDARQLVAASGTRIIEKTRHAIPVEGFMWEVDVYEGTLDGLVIAEVELTSEEDDPVLPPWVGAEVTGDKRWSNQVLAVGGMPEDALRRAESQQA
jgi:CYTH domain-containing protein